VGSFARSLGYGVCEGLSGHGVGYKVHEDPYVPNEGSKGEGEKLVPGMVIAIEPMITLGTDKIVLDKDGYTYKTADGSNAAHFEHTIVITDGDPIILTK
jgi:methionyl aminopeptidase